MPQPAQQVDAFTLIIMEQRNNALNESAFWRAEATKWQALAAEAKTPKKRARQPEAPNGG